MNEHKMNISLEHARKIAAISVFFTLLTFGFVIIWLQVIHIDLADTRVSAKKATDRIELLLDDAAGGSEKASAFLSFPCTPDISQALHRLSIGSPHLRIISLINKSEMTCSSYAGIEPYKVDFSRYTGRRLALFAGNAISPDTPILVLLSTYSEGIVATSINASYATEFLTLLSTDRRLFLRVGNSILSPRNTVQIREELPENTDVVYSSRYPFQIVYSAKKSLPFGQVIEKGGVMMGAYGLLALLSGSIMWRYAVRIPQPYENLERAIRNGEIVPFYQPIVSVRTKKVAGVEVLARWKHPSGTLIPPDIFIPLAEQSGLILALTRDVMKNVARDLAPIISRLSDPFHIGLNISTAHVGNAEFIRDCQRLIAELNHPAVNLVAEITERESFELTPTFSDMLMTLRTMNIAIALDDFGTGYSNLGYLNDLPIQFLKIDKSFVSRIDTAPDSSLLVDCVIEMARKLKLKVIAEGVETHFQAQYLAAQGVDYLQGYYFSRPLPAAAFIRQVVLQQATVKKNLNKISSFELI